MAKKKKDNSKETSSEYPDVEIEKKVDAMMSIEPEETSQEPDLQPPEPSISTAPLLNEENSEKKDKDSTETEPKEVVPVVEVEDKKEPETPETDEISGEDTEPVLDQTIQELQEQINNASSNESAELSQPIAPENLESSEAVSESDAIDDIVAMESDNIMNVEDKQREALDNPVKASKFSKFGKAFKSIFTDPKKRKILIAVVILLILVCALVPTSRYFLLNSFGVRGSSSVKVTDEKTLQPLKNVEVSIGKISSKTDKEGRVTVNNIKLGQQEIVVKKPAFASINKTVVIGWGSNPLGEYKLNPVGSHYNFNLKEFLSSQPIKSAEVETSDGQSTAVSNEKGEVSLVVEDTKQPEIKVKIHADKFREENMTLDRNDKQTREVAMVPEHKHAFVSKRSGKYDLYSVYIDGKDEQKLLSGSGYEKPDTLMISPALESSKIAFITTRDNNRNKDGFLLSSLYLVDVNDKSNKVIARSERIQIIGWFEQRLVFVKTKKSATA